MSPAPIRSALVAIGLAAGVLTTVGLGTASAMAPHASAARHKHRVLPNPYEFLPKVPSFSLTSRTVHSGYPLPRAQWSGVLGEPGGKDESPQLSWRGFPEGTKSFVVSMYDPEAPTGSGFWHWVVANIPASAHTLRLNAGAPGGNLLPHGAFDLDASLGVPRYIGAAPPAGSGLHYYYITVTALNEASTGATATTSPELLGFEIGSHTLARATIICPTSAHSPFSRAGSHSA